jgi:predicted O-linked N-acetylglucosamine transferase (SPINDLY family)
MAPEVVQALQAIARLRRAGRIDEARAAIMPLLDQHQTEAWVWNEAAHVLEALGRWPQAERAYTRAVEIEPGLVEARVNLAGHLSRRHALAEALVHLEHARRLAPDEPIILGNLGELYRKLGQHGRARDALARCLAVAPERPLAHLNLALVLADEGEVAAAIPHLERAVALAPGNLLIQDALLLQMHHATASPGPLEAVHRRYGELIAARIPVPPRPPANGRERRLRVGIVSPDLRTHPVGRLFVPVVRHHDRERTELRAYSCAPVEDELSAVLRAGCARWENVAALDDEALAAQIRADAIDVLVDLAGHTAQNRLAVFARRPAPLQLTWLGYPDTTGLGAIDHRVTDGWADPEGASAWHSEALIRLPGGFIAYTPTDALPAPAPPPCTTGAPFSFGCFNALNKLSAEVLAMWAEILAAVPHARLILKQRPLDDPSTRARLLARLAAAGIPAPRVTMLGHLPAPRHLEAYGAVDVALDTFPYHGTATTLDALWMGVPVVSLAGATHASRVGVSLLERSGNARLIARTPAEYVSLAVGLAGRPDELTAMRASARARMAPLLDGARLCRELEAAIREAWRAIAS